MKVSVVISFLLNVAAAAAAMRTGLGGSSSIRRTRLLQTELTTENEIVNATFVGPNLIDDPNSTGAVIWAGEASPGGAEAAGGGICFSSIATVQVLHQGPTAMKDLQTGDAVLTGSHNYQPVYAFAHKNPRRVVEFLQLYVTSSGKPLEITPKHMVLVHGKPYPVPADSVRVGDVLQDETNVGAIVTKIGTVSRAGIYAPLTDDGTVVVNGVVASCYIDAASGDQKDDFVAVSLFSQHGYYHRGLSPFRMMCQISSRLCHMDNDDGMPYYISFGLWLTNWVHDHNSTAFLWFYQVIFGIVTAMCLVVEHTLLQSRTTALLAATAVSCSLISRGLIKRCNNQKQKLF